MSQKRMFDKKIVESDKFTDLPNSSKALYFMAGMSADDRGFFQPRRLQKLHGFSDDDFKILVAKGYFILFESGVMVVTDWNKNNWLDSRRIVETEYIEEFKSLNIINDKYELNVPCLANAKPMLRENRIEENRIEENNIYSEVINYLNEKTNSSYRTNTKATISKIKARLNEGFTLDDFKKVIDKKCNDWLGTDYEKFLRPETLFGTKFESYLNQKTGTTPFWMNSELKEESDDDSEKIMEELISDMQRN